MPNRITKFLSTMHLLPSRASFSSDVEDRIVRIKAEIRDNEQDAMRAQANIWALRQVLVRRKGYDIRDGTFDDGVGLHMWTQTMRIVNIEAVHKKVLRELLEEMAELDRKWKDLQYKEEKRVEKRLAKKGAAVGNGGVGK